MRIKPTGRDQDKLRTDRGKAIQNILTVRHSEKHRTHRIGWLRAAVLGANDGIVSTASLIVGVNRLFGLRTEKWR